VLFFKAVFFCPDGNHGALSDINRRKNYAVVNLKVGEGFTNKVINGITARMSTIVYVISD
jgi:hypothetical protein